MIPSRAADATTGAPPGGDVVLSFRDVHKRLGRGRRAVDALRGVSFSVRRGCITGLLGPDGAGKTTVMRLAAALLVSDGGGIDVLGLDPVAGPGDVQARIGYMPQRFGLYEDLSVRENLDLYADLEGVARSDRPERYDRLLRMTRLGEFIRRLAGRLSGGMKQKLGLACVLLSSPELLLLDEPTVGVDPLSRRELWHIVDRMVGEEGVSVLLSTAYLDEAERCARVVLLHEGAVLAEGAPADVAAEARGRAYEIGGPAEKPRRLQRGVRSAPGVIDAVLETGRVRVVTAVAGSPEDLVEESGARHEDVRPVEPRFEDGFMLLLDRARRHGDGVAHDAGDPHDAPATEPPGAAAADVVIAVRDLERRFGSFTAVSGLRFEVRRGEIFGLLGPNGAGKSTTFRMLCGLLPPSGGSLEVVGLDLRRAAAPARRRVGYVAQKFSQYGQLSVLENLRFFSAGYGLHGRRRRERVAWALEGFGLTAVSDARSGNLPHGYRQRLAMACALMHEPEVLFLDEPTSGVDPIARRDFWDRIGALADAGVTVVVTTHFLEEAEYCDRLAILVEGEMLALGTPAEIRARTSGDGEATVEDAFIELVETQREGGSAVGDSGGSK